MHHSPSSQIKWLASSILNQSAFHLTLFPIYSCILEFILTSYGFYFYIHRYVLFIKRYKYLMINITLFSCIAYIKHLQPKISLIPYDHRQTILWHRMFRMFNIYIRSSSSNDEYYYRWNKKRKEVMLSKTVINHDNIIYPKTSF